MALEAFTLYHSNGSLLAEVQLPQGYAPGVIVYQNRYFVPNERSMNPTKDYVETTVAWAPTQRNIYDV